MPSVKRHALSDVNLSIGGILIGEGGGESDFLTVETPEKGGAKEGVHGDGAFFFTGKTMATVTITTLQTSTINSDLQSLYNAAQNGDTSGLYTFSLEDVGTAEEMTGTCFFMKDPDVAKTAEVQEYEWRIMVYLKESKVYRERAVTV